MQKGNFFYVGGVMQLWLLGTVAMQPKKKKTLIVFYHWSEAVIRFDIAISWRPGGGGPFPPVKQQSLTVLKVLLSQFPRYKMKCRRKRDTIWNIPRNITFSPLHFMLYRGQLITFGTVDKIFKVSWKNLKVIKVEQNIKNKFESGANLGLYREICGLHNIARLSL